MQYFFFSFFTLLRPILSKMHEFSQLVLIREEKKMDFKLQNIKRQKSWSKHEMFPFKEHMKQTVKREHIHRAEMCVKLHWIDLFFFFCFLFCPLDFYSTNRMWIFFCFSHLTLRKISCIEPEMNNTDFETERECLLLLKINEIVMCSLCQWKYVWKEKKNTKIFDNFQFLIFYSFIFWYFFIAIYHTFYLISFFFLLLSSLTLPMKRRRSLMKRWQ